MAKIHRMNMAEFREWRSNKFLLVKDGTVYRDATAEEVKLNMPVPVVVETEDDEGNTGEKEVECEIVRAREMLERHFWEKYGNTPVQLRRPNGTVIKVVRDPDQPRQSGGNRRCPKPEHCDCRKWAESEPGIHHYACINNQFAPDGERNPRWKNEKQKEERLFAAKPSNLVPLKKGAEPAQTMRAPLVNPDDCNCQQWEGAVAGRHHHICINREEWDRVHPPEEVRENDDSNEEWILYGVDSKEIAREATESEVEEANSKDVPIVEVDGKSYIVMQRKDIRKTA